MIGCLKCENCLKSETAKFQEIYDEFCKEKEAHLQALKDFFVYRLSGVHFLGSFSQLMMNAELV